MRDTELYAQILGVTAPWRVTSVRMESAENRISIEIGYDPDANTPCPKCSKAVSRNMIDQAAMLPTDLPEDPEF